MIKKILKYKYDRDTINFIDAAGGLTDNQSKAIDYLVRKLKQIGEWNNHDIIYPLIGGTSGSTSINLKSPSTYDITWVNPEAATFSVSGVTGDGSTFYGNTNYIGNNFDENNLSVNVLVNNNISGAYAIFGTNSNTTTNGFYILLKSASDSIFGKVFTSTNNITASPNPYGTSEGFWQIERFPIDIMSVYRNSDNVISVPGITSDVVGKSTNTMYIFANNAGSELRYTSPYNVGYFSVSKRISDKTKYYNIVNTFKTLKQL